MEFRYAESFNPAVEAVQNDMRTKFVSEAEAVDFARDIMRAVGNLRAQPNMGITFDARVGRQLISNQIVRMLIAQRYLVFYTVSDEVITLLQLVNGTTDYLNQMDYLFKRGSLE